MSAPVRVIAARAPTRICDNGGWTDTWFARTGAVCHLAVTPAVEVRLTAFRRGYLPKPARLILSNYNEILDLDPAKADWSRHPLLAAGLSRIGLPDGLDCEIEIHSEAPPGASMGTSAAACVALLAGLDALREGDLTPHQLAYEAHAVETEMLGGQSGIQDQLAAAYGGVNWIEMGEFPQAEVQPLALPEAFLAQLEASLLVVYLGSAHSSSAVHEMVIRELEDIGPEHPKLAALRGCAAEARAALLARDLDAYGQALTRNTECQTDLHAELVNAEARAVMQLAQAHGARGWKVNGAGGEGGSLAILAGPDKAGLAAAIRRANPAFQMLPVRLSRAGVQVTTTNG